MAVDDISTRRARGWTPEKPEGAAYAEGPPRRRAECKAKNRHALIRSRSPYISSRVFDDAFAKIWARESRRSCNFNFNDSLLPKVAVPKCADAAAVTIARWPCSTNFSKYAQSECSRECRMCALPPPAASAPARAQPSKFHEHRIDPAPNVSPLSGGRIRNPLIVLARARDDKSVQQCPL
jgi:hypothetical protein